MLFSTKQNNLTYSIYLTILHKAIILRYKKKRFSDLLKTRALIHASTCCRSEKIDFPEVATKTPRRVTWKGKRLYAYQLLCVASQGVLPRQDEVVRHRCHNRRCINPEHLQLGTQQDNIHDERVRQYR